MSLVIDRRVGERLRLRVQIGGQIEDIWIIVEHKEARQVKLVIDAPSCVRIDREEIIDDRTS